MLHPDIMTEYGIRLTAKDMFRTADHRTRHRLLEAAGIVFSEKGFQRATAREICDLANANTAAVNYYFGGKRPLYAEVLREAHRRMVNFDALKALAEDVQVTEERLEGFFAEVLHSVLDPSPERWDARVLLREMASPTEAFDELIEIRVLPGRQLLRTVIARFLDLPVGHEAVIYGAMSMVGLLVSIFQNRRTIEVVDPEIDFKGDGIDKLARHLRYFIVGGLRAAANRTRDEQP